MITNNLNEIIDIFIQTALKAAQTVMQVRADGILCIETKEDDSPLTIADKKAHDILCNDIKFSLPHIPVLSEEMDEHPPLDNPEHPFILIDPIDGTRCFINGSKNFSINIALVQNKQPIAGLIAVPARGRLFYAMKNMGSFERRFNIDNFTLHDNIYPLQSRTAPLEGITILGSPSRQDKTFEEYLNGFKYHKTEHIGSAYKFCLIAAGEADFYPRIGQTYEWDTAAGHIILEESGGKIINIDGNPLTYAKQNYLNDSFIASGKIY